jgi:hypothetical protein
MPPLATLVAQPTPRHERGFILAVTLWIVAAIGLVIVLANEWVSRAIENANVLRERADDELALAEIRDELIFALATRPMTFRGLEVGRFVEKIDRDNALVMMAGDFRTDRFIRMDGRPYRLESHPEYIIRIYDGRGLLNLNSTNSTYLRRFLGLFDLPEAQRNGLLDALEDYIDRDDLTRLSGAEAQDYLRLGRLAPTNSPLLTPLEAQSVLGWDQVPEIWRRERAAPVFTTCRTSGFNPNTAPPEVLLASFPTLLEDDVSEILKRREERPFRNAREIAAAANTLVREEPFFFSFFPGSCVIVELSRPTMGERIRFSLTIENINAKTKPWQVDYVFRLPPSQTPPNAGQSPPEEIFPAPDTLDANQREQPESGRPGTARGLDPQPADDASSDF